MAEQVTGQGFAEDWQLAEGDELIVHFDQGPIPWDKGGLSWTVEPTLGPGQTIDDVEFEAAVESSLFAAGDKWTPDPESPFTETTQGNECNRISRKRFTATEGAITVTMLGGKFRGEIA